MQRKELQEVLSNIESEAAKKVRKDRIKRYDFSITLPLSLSQRVSKIIPYRFDEYDRHAFIGDLDWVDTKISEDLLKEIHLVTDDEDDDFDDIYTKKKEKEDIKLKDIDFSESKYSEIERLDKEFAEFDLKLDKPMKVMVKEKKKVNWCSTYLCKKRKERIKWNSKIYQLNENISEKTLDEQADLLIEAAAEGFSSWMNSLGDNRNTDISKETVKSLFSLEIDRTFLASIHNEPTELKAIAKTMADVWNVPEMALELKFENYVKQRLRYKPKHHQTVIFGRTVPTALRPWVPSKKDDYLKTIFPEEIISGEKIFKGIRHLRTAKALMEYFKKHPTLDPPAYFRRAAGSIRVDKKTTKGHVPLYDQLKLVY